MIHPTLELPPSEKKKKYFFHFVHKQHKLHYLLAYWNSCLFFICADVYSSLKKKRERLFKKYKVNTFYWLHEVFQIWDTEKK